MPSEIQAIKNYFASRHLHVSHYFIECCVKWIREQFNINTEKEFCVKVYEQWLLTDLKQIGEKSLPSNLSKEKNKTIDGNYAVQILYLRDISKSSLLQIKRIRNMYALTNSITDKPDKENMSEGKRVLYLQITDGVQFIFAFEYETVKCLNLNLAPGIKILLTGPLMVRNGELLLKDNNVKILGGEVEDLLVCNHPENILARELNLPENPNPGKIGNQIPSENTQNIVSNNNITNLTENIPRNVTTAYENIQVINSAPSTSRNNDFDDDDLILAEMTVPEEIEHVKTTENNKDLDDLDFMDFEMDEQFDEMQREIENKITCPIKLSGEPFNYIKQIIDNRVKLLGKTVNVKAQFIAVVQKLSFSSSKGWNMKFKITDGTGVIVVDFLSKVLEDLFGITFEQALVLKEKVKNKVVEAIERIEEVIC